MQAAVASIAYLVVHFLTFIYRFNLWNNLEPLILAFSFSHLIAPLHALSVEFGGGKPSSIISKLTRSLVVMESFLCILAFMSKAELAGELIVNLLIVLVPFALMASCLREPDVSHSLSESQSKVVIVVLDKL